MKDTLITAHRKKVELLTWLVCFVMANLLNLYAIIAYKTSFLEVLTSFFYVIMFSYVLYVIWSVLRLVIYGVRTFLVFLKNRTYNK